MSDEEVNPPNFSPTRVTVLEPFVAIRYQAQVSLERDLNPPQREAVEHGEGPLLVLAGAGSGKTRVITHRLAALVSRGVRPWRILAVTFTNKAAGEMRERAARLLGDEAHKIWIGTFHATCAKLLRIYTEAAGLRPGFLICDDSDQRSLIVRIMKDFNISDRVITPRALMSGIDRAKNQGIRAEHYQGHDFVTDQVEAVYPEYQRRLRTANAVDFGDLLIEVVHLAAHPEVGPDLASRFDHVLVDEFQDTNQVQHQLTSHLAVRTGNLCVVGDDDQSIYGWRGAKVENILGFADDRPGCKVVKLEQNYRSTQSILDAANGVIAHNHGRMQKRLFTELGTGQSLQYYTATDERREADYIVNTIKRLCAEGDRVPGDCAVFYRTHAQSRVLEEAFRAGDLPYAVLGGMRFFDRAEVKDLLAYLRVLVNPDDHVSLERIINVPVRGIGETTIEKVRELARQRNLSLWQAMRTAIDQGCDVLGTGARKKLAAFTELIDELRPLAEGSQGLFALAERLLERSGYLERLAIDGTKESQDRLLNLQEAVGSLGDYERETAEPSLVGYLERVALVSPADGEARGVSLMTIHAAKGLEFPVVFVTGLEEGTFPRMDDEDPEELAEERRLAYVAITRARERLFLTNAARRRLFGREQHAVGVTPPLDGADPYSQRESRFIADLPPHCVTRLAPARSSRSSSSSFISGRVRQVEHHLASSAARPPTNERYIEYDETPYRLGQQVRHSVFGVGEVRAYTGQGEGLKLTIYFPAAGTKTLVARFIQPA